MKRLKRVLPVLLAVIICISGNSFVTSAASVKGRAEGTPIDLSLGKSKSAKFQEGIESVYFWVELKNTGKLKVSFSAESLGAGVTMVLHKQGEYVWKQTKALQYNKNKKTTSGTLTSEYILPAGGYIIEVTPDKSLTKTKKFKMTVKCTEVSFDDKEPNNTEEQAQSMTIQKKNGKAVSYQMFLSTQADVDKEDTSDCFQFKLKETKKLRIKLKLKEKASGVKLMVRKKTADGYSLVGMYDIDSTFDKKLSLEKGTYYLRVWYDTLDKKQVPYTISATVIESAKN